MRLLLCWLTLLISANLLPAQHRSLTAQELRLHQIQMVGTHNSYHVAPAPDLLQTIRLLAPDIADAIDYTHRPLAEQFDRGIRQIELDLFADSHGGLFATPVGHRALRQSDPSAAERETVLLNRLQSPGMKIIHSPDFDYRTTVATLHEALQQVRNWSQQHPNHVPILILLELKETVHGPAVVRPLAFNAQLLDAVDAEIHAVFAAPHRLVPDDIRGEKATLREAIFHQGWPPLSKCRGKAWFALDNEDHLRELYLAGRPNLAGRAMFVSVDPQHPAAAFQKLNDPVRNFAQIQAAVRSGLIVRTRADADTRQARQNDPTRRDRAFASGAQYISTDYPEPDARFSDYRVQLPGNAPFRVNPLHSFPPPSAFKQRPTKPQSGHWKAITD